MKYVCRVASILITLVLLCVSISFADLKELQERALMFGSQGDFSKAKEDLANVSNTLSSTKPGNFHEQAKSTSALGFVQAMASVANDCLSGSLPGEVGKLLFQASISAREADLKKAISLTEQALASKPEYPPSNLLLARLSSHACLQRGVDCQKSIGIYQTAIKYDPKMTAAYLDMGMVYTQNKQIESAINAYETALELNPGGFTAGWVHEQMALLYAMQEKWRLANKHSQLASSLGMPLPTELSSEIESRLDNKVDLNEELRVAVKNGNINEVRSLLDKGVDVDTPFKGGETSLHGAVLNGRKDLVEFLISKGANINARDRKYQATPLHLAAYQGHKEVVEVLLAKGADINAKDTAGDTPLDNAKKAGHRAIVELIKNFVAKIPR